VALVTVIASIAFRRWWPKVPHMIAAMLAGSLVALMLNQVFGGAHRHREHRRAADRSAAAVEAAFDRTTIEQLVPIAIAVGLLALTEAVSIARAVALKSGQRIDGNQEFIGQGLSNLAGAFFSGYASSGSFNRSGLNYDGRGQDAAGGGAVGGVPADHRAVPRAAGQVPADRGDGRHPVRRRLGLIDFAQIAEIVRASRPETAVLAGDLHRHADAGPGVRDLHRRAAVADAVPEPHLAPRPGGRQAVSEARVRRRSAGHRPARLPAAEDRAHQRLDLLRRGQPPAGGACSTSTSATRCTSTC
jgi:hypothetical protein